MSQRIFIAAFSLKQFKATLADKNIVLCEKLSREFSDTRSKKILYRMMRGTLRFNPSSYTIQSFAPSRTPSFLKRLWEAQPFHLFRIVGQLDLLNKQRPAFFLIKKISLILLLCATVLLIILLSILAFILSPIIILVGVCIYYLFPSTQPQKTKRLQTLNETRAYCNAVQAIILLQNPIGLPNFNGHLGWKSEIFDEVRNGGLRLDVASEKLLNYLQFGRPFFGTQFSERECDTEWGYYAYLTVHEAKQLLKALEFAKCEHDFIHDLMRALKTISKKGTDLWFRSSAEYF